MQTHLKFSARKASGTRVRPWMSNTFELDSVDCSNNWLRWFYFAMICSLNDLELEFRLTIELCSMDRATKKMTMTARFWTKKSNILDCNRVCLSVGSCRYSIEANFRRVMRSIDCCLNANVRNGLRWFLLRERSAPRTCWQRLELVVFLHFEWHRNTDVEVLEQLIYDDQDRRHRVDLVNRSCPMSNVTNDEQYQCHVEVENWNPLLNFD